MVVLLALVFMCGVVWHLVTEREELMEKLQEMTALMLGFPFHRMCFPCFKPNGTCLDIVAALG